ncbi:MAG: hypothetical protein JST80_02590 [Bdellovibrionales bacterium]|nr:hypothetical protein [Bdellovibrionales bacterium]
MQIARKRSCVGVVSTIIFSLVSGACASTPKESSLDAPLTPEVRKDLEKYCSKGNPFACYRIGSDLDDKKNWGEAKVWFVKACDLRLGAACSEASVMAKSHLNEKEEAIKLATKACDLNDTLGCYNQGCYECLYQNNPTAAFKSLELAVKLGYRNLTSLENDPDLECARKNKNWDAFVKKIPSEGDAKVTHRYALSTGARHLYHPKLKFSYSAVPGFHIQYSVSGVMVYDDAGSRIYFTGSNQSYSEVADLVRKNTMIESGEKVMSEEEGTVNGYKALSRVVKGTLQGLEYIAAIYVTGDDKYTVTSQSTYLASYHSTYGAAILQNAESIVIDPRGPPGVAELPYVDGGKIGSYKYAGIQSGGPLWTQSGLLPYKEKSKDRNKFDTLVVNSFVFTKDDPFAEDTFQKVWEMVAAQSSIDVAKLDPKKLKKDKTDGNLAWHYLSDGKQVDREGNKHDIQLEVGLVKLPHHVTVGDLGYFWARVIKSGSRDVTKDTSALSKIKIKPSVIKEMEEMPAEEPEVTAPSSGTGDGAIPTS